MFDQIRLADRLILLVNTLLLMAVAFLPFATSVLAGALRSGHGQRTAVVFYSLMLAVTALMFNGAWRYASNHRLLNQALDPAGVTAIGRRFHLASVSLAAGALRHSRVRIPPSPLAPGREHADAKAQNRIWTILSFCVPTHTEFAPRARATAGLPNPTVPVTAGAPAVVIR
jgi:hypothetical protein